MISRKCEECEEVFECYPSSKRKFCSTDCSRAAQSKRQTGKNNPCWKGGVKSKEEIRKYNREYRKKNKDNIRKQRRNHSQIIKVKLNTKEYQNSYRKINIDNLKEYDKNKYKNRPKNNICINCGKLCANDFFCNNKCKGKIQSEKQKGNNNPSWKDKIKITCEICGKIKMVSPCYSSQKYCSSECKGFSKVGKSNPNWKNGVTPLSCGIRELRENKMWRVSVFERDKYTCVLCGKVGGYIEAHHVISFNEIIKKNNITSIIDAKLCNNLWDISNGITVCKSCHADIDEHRFIKNQ